MSAGATIIRGSQINKIKGLLNDSGVLGQVERWTERDAALGGRPSKYTPSQTVLLMAVTTYVGRAATFTAATELLMEHLEDDGYAALGIVPDFDREATGVQHGREFQKVYQRLRRSFTQVLKAVDPSDTVKNRRGLPLQRRDVPDEIKQRNDDRLLKLSNLIVQAALKSLPTATRKRMRHGAIDATKFQVFARGVRRGKNVASSDPDASWYVRDDEHVWAMEAHLLVLLDLDGENCRRHPLVVGAMSVARPAVEPGRNARRCIEQAQRLIENPGFVAADRGYTPRAPLAEYVGPARSMGWDPLTDYDETYLGQPSKGSTGGERVTAGGGGSFAGALQIEGWLYCPMIPEHLITATRRFRNHEITELEYRKLVEERQLYAVTVKQAGRQPNSIVIQCPAAGGAPTVKCSGKDRLLAGSGVDYAPSGAIKPGRRMIPLVPDVPDRICTQRSVTVPADAEVMRFLQSVQFESADWNHVYHSLRNAIEGVNGIYKDGSAFNTIKDATRRRVRGIAGQTMLMSLLIFANNLKACEKFLKKACPDADGNPVIPVTRRGDRRRARRRVVTPRRWATGIQPVENL